MPSIEWKYAWLADGGIDPPETTPLRPWDKSPDSIDEIVQRIGHMTERFGQPKIVMHTEGIGILWPNKGMWGMWVMVVKDG